MKTKHLDILIEKSASAEFDGKFIMSAATPDRVRDTIDPKAYDGIAARTKKLIALFNHDSDKIAGFWTNLKREGDTLVGHIKFASTSLGQMLKTLLDDGVPLGASIGFRGRGEPNDKGGILFKEIDLMETSIVSTPAHPRAMQIAKQFNITLPVQKQGGADPAESGDFTAVRKRAALAIIAAKRQLKEPK
jgi:HK97 family phage prohead protease